MAPSSCFQPAWTAGTDRPAALLPHARGRIDRGVEVPREIDRRRGVRREGVAGVFLDGAVGRQRRGRHRPRQAGDGGVVIAMNAPQARLFEAIPWGTERVLAATLAAAGSSVVRLLPALWDVDDGADLARWRRSQSRPMAK